MSDLRSQIEGFAEGLSLKEKTTLTRLLISLDKNETAKATAAKKQLLSLFTLAAKSQGKKRDLYTSALNKYLAAHDPGDFNEQIEKAQSGYKKQRNKASSELDQLEKQMKLNNTEFSLIEGATRDDFNSFLKGIFQVDGRNVPIPVGKYGTYRIFANMAGDNTLYDEIDQVVRGNSTLEQGEAFVRNAAAESPKLVEAYRRYLTQDADGQEIMRRIQEIKPSTFNKNEQQVLNTLATQMANSTRLAALQTYYESDLDEATANLEDLGSGDPNRIGSAAGGWTAKLLEDADEFALQYVNLAMGRFPDPEMPSLTGEDAEGLGLGSASSLAGSDTELLAKLIGASPEAARSLLGKQDPVAKAVLAFEDARTDAVNNPNFLLWRQQTGSPGEGVPSFNEFRRYNRQAMRAQRGGVFGPTTKRTGDIRLIRYRDRTGAAETDAGTIYFYDENGAPVRPEVVGEKADSAVRNASVVMFDLRGEGADGKSVDKDGNPIIDTQKRNTVGMAIAATASDEMRNALRSEGAQVYFDKTTGDTVILDKNRVVLATQRLEGEDLNRLTTLGSNSEVADVLGDLSGFSKMESDNAVESGGLAGVIEGAQANQFSPYVPAGFAYTSEAPMTTLSGELVYVPGQGMVANVMTRGKRGRGDEGMITIPAEDIVSTSKRGREGYEKAKQEFAQSLAANENLTDAQRAEILESQTFGDDEYRKVFRRPLRVAFNDVFKGRERRAKVEAKKGTMPFQKALSKVTKTEEEVSDEPTKTPTEPTTDAPAETTTPPATGGTGGTGGGRRGTGGVGAGGAGGAGGADADVGADDVSEGAGGTVQGPPISLGEGTVLSMTQVPTEDAGQTSAKTFQPPEALARLDSSPLQLPEEAPPEIFDPGDKPGPDYRGTLPKALQATDVTTDKEVTQDDDKKTPEPEPDEDPNALKISRALKGSLRGASLL